MLTDVLFSIFFLFSMIHHISVKTHLFFSDPLKYE